MHCFAALILAGSSLAGAPADVPRWTRYEAAFTSHTGYANPAQEVRLRVEFRSPSGEVSGADGFWDGGRTWRVRFSPGETGVWTWTSRAAPADAGLHNQSGRFVSVPYTGANPVFRHGPVRVAASRHHLELADGIPFLWLGDTAWNGPVKAAAGDWDRYLADRTSKGFNVIQYIATNWRAAPADEQGRTAWKGRERIEIVPEFFQRMDARVAAINEHGLYAAPVLLWVNGTRTLENPGNLPEDQAILLARYIVARYGAHQLVWLLNGDGNYTGEHAARWKRIGDAVFPDGHPGRISSLHPARTWWLPEWYLDKSWFHFSGYQSGHRDGERHLRLLTEGPLTRAWRQQRRVPSINLEPNYEAHNNRSVGPRVFTDYDVRRAVYWSLLVSPPAGVTYGAHGIWNWALKPEEPIAHAGTGVSAPWREAMNLPGSAQIRHVKSLFESFEWWRLRPAQELLAAQPGATDPRCHIAAAQADDGTWALAYLPCGGPIRLRDEAVKRLRQARWYDPRTGAWRDAQPAAEMTAPGENDWVLHLGRKGKPQPWP